jgi:hypothetical protein
MSSPDHYKMGQCYVHKGPVVDTRLLHEHHKHPKGYGGSNDPDNLVWLCGSCHDLVHRLAHYIRRGKSGLVSDLAQQYQAAQNLSPAGRHRLLELAHLVATSMDTFIPEDMEEFDEEDTVLVQIPLPRTIHKTAKYLASCYKNSGSGRQMGLYRYLSIVITNHVLLAGSTKIHNKNPNKLYVVDGGQGEEQAIAPSEDSNGLRPIE